MLLLNIFNRFSVDIDILMKPKDQDGICNDVFTLKDDKFIEAASKVFDDDILAGILISNALLISPP